MSTEVKIKLPNGKSHISPSSGKQLAKHPLSYLAYVNDKFEPNEEMIFGMYYEDLLFGVDTEDRFFVFDDEQLCEVAMRAYGKQTDRIRSTKVYKEMYSGLMREAEGKYIISEEQHEIALKMGIIMQDSGVFDEWLSGDTQVTKSAVIDTGKYIVDKALVRSDVVMPTGEVVDLKTTSSDLDAWLNHGKRLGYDIQSYLSMEIYDVDEFTFVVQRTKGLHDIGVFTIARDSWYFESGKRKFNQAVENYLEYFSESAIQLGAEPSHYVKRVTIV